MTLLNPEQRTIYSDLFTPPPGYRFDCSVATTYSLSLSTLLAVPLRLTLFGVDDEEKLIENRIALLEALRRTTGRLTLYCERGRIAAERTSALAALLEPMVREVRLPTGSFHAKIWLLRYVATGDVSNTEPVLLRLGIPSRNVTLDRSWDVALVLNGYPTGRAKANNRPLAQLLEWLAKQDPSLDAERVTQISVLRDEASRTDWQLPSGFDSLEYAVTGIGKRVTGWPLPPGARRLAVISPFIRSTALNQLAKEVAPGAPLTLVSRANELSTLPTTFARELRWRPHVLHQGLFDEPGEDSALAATDSTGELHAKIYLADYAAGRGGNLSIVVGSANATNAALIDQRNIEIMVRLTGRHGALGTSDDFLGPAALGKYLRAFEWPAKPTKSTPSTAEKALEAARQSLLDAKWKLRFAPAGVKEWAPLLCSSNPLRLPASVICTTRLVTMPENRAIGLSTSQDGTALARCATADATAFVAFVLSTEGVDDVSLVLNLPDTELPDGRDSAVLRSVISNSHAFLSYLRFLLGDLGGIEEFEELLRANKEGGGPVAAGIVTVPLLEDLVRATSRAPERLAAIQRLMRQVAADEELRAVVPGGFEELWASFTPLINERTGP